MGLFRGEKPISLSEEMNKGQKPEEPENNRELGDLEPWEVNLQNEKNWKNSKDMSQAYLRDNYLTIGKFIGSEDRSSSGPAPTTDIGRYLEMGNQGSRNDYRITLNIEDKQLHREAAGNMPVFTEKILRPVGKKAGALVDRMTDKIWGIKHVKKLVKKGIETYNKLDNYLYGAKEVSAAASSMEVDANELLRQQKELLELRQAELQKVSQEISQAFIKYGIFTESNQDNNDMFVALELGKFDPESQKHLMDKVREGLNRIGVTLSSNQKSITNTMEMQRIQNLAREFFGAFAKVEGVSEEAPENPVQVAEEQDEDEPNPSANNEAELKAKEKREFMQILELEISQVFKQFPPFSDLKLNDRIISTLESGEGTDQELAIAKRGLMLVMNNRKLPKNKLPHVKGLIALFEQHYPNLEVQRGKPKMQVMPERKGPKTKTGKLKAGNGTNRDNVRLAA